MSYGQLFGYASLSWAVISLALLWIAWRAVAAEKLRLHRTLMVLMTAGAWLFIAGYLARYRQPGALPEIDPAYLPWLALHGTLGLVPLFGATTLVIARFRQRRGNQPPSHLNRHHRRYGRLFVAVWAFTHVGGIVNYWLFF